MRCCLAAWLAIWLVVPMAACAHSDAQERARAPARVMPPSDLACDRNDLTSYNGRVIAYHRTADRLSITILTDWETQEVLQVPMDTVRHSFVVRGRRLAKPDWAAIEQSATEAHAGLRVIAWVCLDERTPPVLDWRPAQPPAG